MRYNPGDKKVRNTAWIKIPFKVTGKAKHEIHNWCSKLPGPVNGMGKFYHHFAGDHWWFEYKEDAVMFNLKWAGHG